MGLYSYDIFAEWPLKKMELNREIVRATNIFDNLGYALIGPVDGHDFKAMERAFSKAKKIDKSVIVHIKTIKGKGYKYAEDDRFGNWHGVSPFDKETGKPLVETPLTWSELYSEVLLAFIIFSSFFSFFLSLNT